MFLPIVLGTLIPTSFALVQAAETPRMQHLGNPHILAPGQEGQWKSAPGNRRVEWTAGTADPNHTRLIASTLGEPDKAARLFDKHHRSLGNVANALGRSSEAESTSDADIDGFRVALQFEPEDVSAHIRLGIALAEKGRVEEAIAAYRKAVKLRPDNASAHHNLAIALASKGQVDEAIAEYRAALRAQPDDACAHVGLGVALAGKGQADAAVAEFRAAVQVQPDDASAHYNLAIALAGKGQVDEAITEYRTTVKLRPDDACAHVGLGIALAGKGQADAAVVAFRAAVRARPDDASTHISLGTALASMGQTEQAIAEYRQALELRPDNASAHYNLAIALAGKGQAEEAIAEYRAALRSQPDDACAHVGLGIALAGVGQADAAIAEFRAALRVQPDDLSAHYNLGTALVCKGQTDAAIVEFRAMLKLRPDDASAYIGLGTALMGRGEFAGALEALRKGHELGSGLPGWPYPSAQWVRDAERLAALDARLPALLRGDGRSADPDETLSLARICRLKGLHATSARLYQDAFAQHPERADDPASTARYNAACAAAQAGSGRSKDEPLPDGSTRASLRNQALEWLRAELVVRTKQWVVGTPSVRHGVQQNLRYWQRDPALAGLRDEAEVAKLSEAERAACLALWAQVDALLGNLASSTNRSAR